MATLLAQFTVGTSVPFQSRVQAAMVRHAQFRVEEGNDALGLVTLGKQILNAPETYTPRFAQVVATMPGVQAGVESSPTDGADVTDLEIQTAVETVYPSFTG